MNILKSCAIGSAVLLSVNAHADDIDFYIDELASCQIASLSENDKKILQTVIIQTIFFHPNFADKNPYTPSEINQTKQQAAELLARLYTKDCIGQLVNLTQYGVENSYPTQYTGGLVGEIVNTYALEDLMNHPDAHIYRQEIVELINPQEAGQAITDFLRK